MERCLEIYRALHGEEVPEPSGPPGVGDDSPDRHLSHAKSVHDLLEGLNPYEKIIVSVATVLMDYDTDQMVPLFGFGGRFKGKQSHYFPLGDSLEVHGMEGIISAYHSW